MDVDPQLDIDIRQALDGRMWAAPCVGEGGCAALRGGNVSPAGGAFSPAGGAFSPAGAYAPSGPRLHSEPGPAGPVEEGWRGMRRGYGSGISPAAQTP